MLAFIEFLDSRVPLSPATKKLLMDSIEIKYYKAHRFLRQKGDLSDKIFFIRKGLVQLYRNKEKTDWLSCENEVICPYNRFLQQQPSSVYYETLEPTEVQTINHSAYLKLQEISEFRDVINQVVIERLYRVNKFLLEISCSAAGRYNVFVNHFPSFSNRVQANIMASFLGLCAKTISRVKNGDKATVIPIQSNVLAVGNGS